MLRNRTQEAAALSRIVVALAVLLCAGRADAGKAKDARSGDAKAAETREYVDKAATAYALGRYAVAAENYEKAFELKPDPGVLYNAAQAHRLAGNKQRALDLYQGYLRMYGSESRPDVEKHIENLKQAIEKERSASAPAAPSPSGGAPPETLKSQSAASPESTASSSQAAPSSPPAAPKPAEPTPVLVAQASTSETSDDGSVVKKPWFWVVVGGAVVGAVVAGVLLTRRDPVDPTGTLMPGNGD